LVTSIQAFEFKLKILEALCREEPTREFFEENKDSPSRILKNEIDEEYVNQVETKGKSSTQRSHKKDNHIISNSKSKFDRLRVNMKGFSFGYYRLYLIIFMLVLCVVVI
jgi:hypothetical protein